MNFKPQFPTGDLPLFSDFGRRPPYYLLLKYDLCNPWCQVLHFRLAAEHAIVRNLWGQPEDLGLTRYKFRGNSHLQNMSYLPFFEAFERIGSGLINYRGRDLFCALGYPPQLAGHHPFVFDHLHPKGKHYHELPSLCASYQNLSFHTQNTRHCTHPKAVE